jgi:hypothetical protein
MTYMRTNHRCPRCGGSGFVDHDDPKKRRFTSSERSFAAMFFGIMAALLSIGLGGGASLSAFFGMLTWVVVVSVTFWIDNKLGLK